MVKHALLLAALLAAVPAQAGQLVVATPRGPHYVPAPRGWLAPRPPYLNGYVRQWRPNLDPSLAAMPRPVPPRPVVAPMPDAIDEIPETNLQGITRAEVESAIADYCSRNATASLCVKLQSR